MFVINKYLQQIYRKKKRVKCLIVQFSTNFIGKIAPNAIKKIVEQNLNFELPLICNLMSIIMFIILLLKQPQNTSDAMSLCVPYILWLNYCKSYQF